MKKVRFSVKSKTRKSKKATLENDIQKIDFNNQIYIFPFSLEPPKKTRKNWFLKEIHCLKRAVHTHFRCNGSFHEAVAPILAMAQCFAVMPVVGVKSSSAADLHFKWKSLRTIYSVLAFVGLFSYVGFTFAETFRQKIEFAKMIAVMFYLTTSYGLLYFLILAMVWPTVMKRWESVESKLPKFRNQKEKNEIAEKIRVLAVVVLTAALMEHLMNIISIVRYVNNCFPQNIVIEEFFKGQLSPLFKFVTYAPWKAILGKWVTVIGTFVWTFMDLFVMIISVGLSTRFKQINKDLMRNKGEHMSKEYWIIRRTQYHQLSSLCLLVDKVTSKIIIASFPNNLYFICVQLLRGLRPMPSFEHTIYFWLSFAFLIARTLSVSLYAAAIWDESRKPLEVLRAVPTESWCMEVRRFSEEVENSTAALSGMRFFFLTRKLILSVAATILTYELVLFQFETEKESQPICIKKM